MCTAGSLPVQWVFHSVILQPMRKASLKNLSRLDSIYTQILHAADKLDITSLAMPLIGAGNNTAAIRSRGIKICSTQMTMEFIMFINVKMPTIVGILTFISMINTAYDRLKARKVFIIQHFSFYEQLKFHAKLS